MYWFSHSKPAPSFPTVTAHPYDRHENCQILTFPSTLTAVVRRLGHKELHEEKPVFAWLPLCGQSGTLAATRHVQTKGGGLQDGRGVRHGDHLPPYKHIRNTSTHGTAPTEHLLNAGRRRQTSQKARNSPHTWGGQKKKETTETKE